MPDIDHSTALEDSSHSATVVDSDSACTIDTKTRIVSNNTLKNVLIQFDHNSERVGFTMDRYVEGHDMTLCNKVSISYVNGPSSGTYIVTDLKVSEDDSNKITFTWLVSRGATQNVGSLVFGINFRCTDEESNVIYSWSTRACDLFSIVSGVNSSEGIDYNQYTDLIAHFQSQLDYIMSKLDLGGTPQEAMLFSELILTGEVGTATTEEIEEV